MKRIAILLAATAFVAGCSEPEPAPEPTSTETVAPEVEGGLAIDGKPNAGTYEVTSPDGSVTAIHTVNADGTLTTVQGEQTAIGNWTSTGPGNWCVTYAGESETKCYAETITEAGVYTSTNVDDPADTWIVNRTS